MLQIVALTPAVLRVARMPFRASVCIVTCAELLAQACAARSRDVVIVPVGELGVSGVRAVRRGMRPDALLVGVARTIDEATAATIELSLYDHVATAGRLEAELASIIGHRTTLERAVVCDAR
jgi:hypothetical protein